MIEIISILASLVIVILTPIQTAQICAGKAIKGYKGTREENAAVFNKQLGFLIWLAPVLAILNLAMILIETEPGEWIVKSIAAGLWLTVFAVTFRSRGKLARLESPNPSSGDARSS